MESPQQTLSIIKIEEFRDHILLARELACHLDVVSAAFHDFLSVNKFAHIPEETTLGVLIVNGFVSEDQEEEILEVLTLRPPQFFLCFLFRDSH
jgi:hypothetical protein